MLDFRRHRKGVDEIALRGADHLVRRFLCVTFAGALFTALAFGAQVPRKSPARNIPHLAHPKLVVMIVVDQMRGDYVDKFRGQWTGGLKRLVEEGAWFREAAYPYAATETRAAAVYRAEDLSGLDSGGSQIRTALTLDYFHGRSGDQFIVPRPYWHVHGSPAGKKAGGGTGHGTPYNYDQHVPLLLLGYGIQPGEYFAAVTPADIAPTFAALCGITLATRDGRVLEEALHTRASK